MARISLKRWGGLAVTAVAFSSLNGASANSISYTYDTLGRLIQTFNSSTGYRDKYALDTADNRNNVETRDVVFQLNANQSIKSPDGRFTLIMQGDGNLVVYSPSSVARWNSGTGGNPAAELDVQSDGNLVIYTGAGSPIWASGTGGH